MTDADSTSPYAANPGLTALLSSAAARQQASATARSLVEARRRQLRDAAGDPRVALFAEGREFTGGSFASGR